MPGIDVLISRYLANEIKSGLKPSILKKIERDLFFIHGMSIKLSIEHFDTFHNLLNTFPDFDIQYFERRCMKKIINITKLDDVYSIQIINSKLLNKIINYFGDPECRALLYCIMGKNLTIPTILDKTKIQKSSAYRKIESMLLDGLIIEHGTTFSNNKRVSLYHCLFHEVVMTIGEAKITIDAKMGKKDFESSSTFKSELYMNNHL